jgi:tetratricopeptide (TPR) repeat protein
VGLGRVAETEGNLEQALAQYERARGQAPGSEPALHAEASLLIKMSRSSEARRVIEAGLDSLPESGLLLSDLGLLDLRQGDLDSAITNLERALAADPSNLAARGNLAMAYEDKGLAEKAIREYRSYLESAPPGPARDKASEALKRLGSD